jgi:hypothetical protein
VAVAAAAKLLAAVGLEDTGQALALLAVALVQNLPYL